mmetsp:Transcript_2429/g.4814  ORF Transcript_2429/g.4814 Transcript_2429/m.4814 type:complete len:1229 (+) Transcript_2429:427-4113(+)
MVRFWFLTLCLGVAVGDERMLGPRTQCHSTSENLLAGRNDKVCGYTPFWKNRRLCRRPTTHAKAEQRCRATNGRLCSRSEVFHGELIDRSNGEGCGLHIKYLWTSTRCGQDSYAIVTGNGVFFTCKPASSRAGRVRCCYDVPQTYYQTIQTALTNVQFSSFYNRLKSNIGNSYGKVSLTHLSRDSLVTVFQAKIEPKSSKRLYFSDMLDLVGGVGPIPAMCYNDDERCDRQSCDALPSCSFGVCSCLSTAIGAPKCIGDKELSLPIYLTQEPRSHVDIKYDATIFGLDFNFTLMEEACDDQCFEDLDCAKGNASFVLRPDGELVVEMPALDSDLTYDLLKGTSTKQKGVELVKQFIASDRRGPWKDLSLRHDLDLEFSDSLIGVTGTVDVECDNTRRKNLYHPKAQTKKHGAVLAAIRMDDTIFSKVSVPSSDLEPYSLCRAFQVFVRDTIDIGEETTMVRGSLTTNGVPETAWETQSTYGGTIDLSFTKDETSSSCGLYFTSYTQQDKPIEAVMKDIIECEASYKIFGSRKSDAKRLDGKYLSRDGELVATMNDQGLGRCDFTIPSGSGHEYASSKPLTVQFDLSIELEEEVEEERRRLKRKKRKKCKAKSKGKAKQNDAPAWGGRRRLEGDEEESLVHGSVTATFEGSTQVNIPLTTNIEGITTDVSIEETSDDSVVSSIATQSTVTFEVDGGTRRGGQKKADGSYDMIINEAQEVRSLFTIPASRAGNEQGSSTITLETDHSLVVETDDVVEDERILLSGRESRSLGGKKKKRKKVKSKSKSKAKQNKSPPWGGRRLLVDEDQLVHNEIKTTSTGFVATINRPLEEGDEDGIEVQLEYTDDDEESEEGSDRRMLGRRRRKKRKNKAKSKSKVKSNPAPSWGGRRQLFPREPKHHVATMTLVESNDNFAVGMDIPTSHILGDSQDEIFFDVEVELDLQVDNYVDNEETTTRTRRRKKRRKVKSKSRRNTRGASAPAWGGRRLGQEGNGASHSTVTFDSDNNVNIQNGIHGGTDIDVEAVIGGSDQEKGVDQESYSIQSGSNYNVGTSPDKSDNYPDGSFDLSESDQGLTADTTIPTNDLDAPDDDTAVPVTVHTNISLADEASGLLSQSTSDGKFTTTGSALGMTRRRRLSSSSSVSDFKTFVDLDQNFNVDLAFGSEASKIGIDTVVQEAPFKCVTDGGQSAYDSPCKFPFTYQGKRYTSCAPVASLSRKPYGFFFCKATPQSVY